MHATMKSKAMLQALMDGGATLTLAQGFGPPMVGRLRGLPERIYEKRLTNDEVSNLGMPRSQKKCSFKEKKSRHIASDLRFTPRCVRKS